MTAHVSDVEIERFSRRELSPEAIVRVTGHLVECADCQKRALAKEAPARADERLLRELADAGAHVPEDEIQAYVDRGLPAPRRSAIEQHLALCPRCAAEIRDLEAFANGIRLEARRRRVWSYGALAAAAVLVLAVAGIVERRQASAGNTAESPDNRQARVERPANVPVSSPAPPVMSGAPTSRGVVSLQLEVHPVRGVDSSAPPAVVIDQGVDEVVIRLALRDIDYQRYRITLRSARGTELFTRQNLEPEKDADPSGASLHFSVPAERLAAGDYVLALRGEDRAGEVEDVSTSLFRVKRK